MSRPASRPGCEALFDGVSGPESILPILPMRAVLLALSALCGWPAGSVCGLTVSQRVRAVLECFHVLYLARECQRDTQHTPSPRERT